MKDRETAGTASLVTDLRRARLFRSSVCCAIRLLRSNSARVVLLGTGAELVFRIEDAETVLDGTSKELVPMFTLTYSRSGDQCSGVKSGKELARRVVRPR